LNVKPAEIVEACEKRGVKLRINPTDGKLTATPKRKVPADLLQEIRKCRADLIEFIEERDGGGQELTIDDLPPPEPAKPSIAETIISTAAAMGITITLDHPNAMGMIKVITPWVTRMVPDPKDVANGNPKDNPLPWVDAPPEISALIDTATFPDADYVNMQRSQIPIELRMAIDNFRPELIAYLRAPYLPDPGPEPVDNPAKRSIWERMARPDSNIPGARDNQKRIKQLLFGDHKAVEDRRAAQRRNMLDLALPTIVAANAARQGGKK
jgi:hypothetical protein